MAVLRQVWRFSLEHARTALQEVRGFDSLLQSSVVEIAERVRSREACRDLLVLARLAPDDDETWEGVLHPRAEDFGIERAAAGRLVALLADISQVLDDGVEAPPQFLEEAILRAGWTHSEAAQILRGKRLPTLLRKEHLVPGDVVDRCETWLPGGWLPADRARSWAHELDVESDRLKRAMDEAAEHIAARTPLADQAVRQQLKAGLAKLSARYGDASGIVWILQD